MTFMSAPTAFKRVQYVCRNVCQPIRLLIPTRWAAGSTYSRIKISAR
jgi:hypothetical protein